MRKLLNLWLFSALCATSPLMAKVFIGADGGYDSGEWNVDINAGYEAFANDYFGGRGFGSLEYGAVDNKFDTEYTIKFDANADMILNFVKSGAAGILAGVSTGYEYKPGVSAIPFTARAGFTFAAGKNMRFDITARLPFAEYNLKTSKFALDLQPVTAQVGMKVLF